MKKTVTLEINGEVKKVTLDVPDGMSEDEVNSQVQQMFSEGDKFTPKTIAQKAAEKTNQQFMGALPAAGKYVSENLGDISLSTGGGALGLLVPGGPVVKGLARAASSIAGSTIGKEVDQSRLGQENVPIAQNALMATGEELFGIATGAITSKPASAVMRWMGFKPKATKIEDEFIEGAILTPEGETRTGIKEAQERLLGGRELTVFEETGGGAGRQLQAVLDREVTSSTGYSSLASEWQTTRNAINEKIVEALREETISTPKFESAIKDTFVKSADHLKKQMNNLEGFLLDKRQKVKIPVDGIEDEINNVIPYLNQKLDKPTRDKILQAMRSELMEQVIDPATKQKTFRYKDSLSLAEIESLEKNVMGAVRAFKPSKSFQDKDIGVYKAYLEPLITNKISAAKGVMKPEDLAVLEANEQYASIARKYGELTNSKVGRSIGLSGLKQDFDSKTAQKLDKIIFESPETWDETVEILDVVGAADVVDRLKQRYRYNLFKEAYDPATKSITGKALAKAISDPEKVAYIAGEDYLQTLVDAEVITRGLATTNYLADASKQKISPIQDIAQNAVRTMAHPLYGRMKFVSGVLSAMKGSIGLGQVSDKQLFKAFQGERGENLVRRMVETPLVSPESYGLYVQLVRELGKAGADIQMLSRDRYYNNVVGAMSAMEQQETQQ